ncbi:hypothetical protein EYF80_002861 [Liparis tanakae]|uniref:Uncharacterized protein n=1 Tax=Liparis tanakae TaxID=230148 RepID=A0A4Z2JAA9_9TELE|nr:hypothetical protein EYF80_002861 [Liparis tanakae]
MGGTRHGGVRGTDWQVDIGLSRLSSSLSKVSEWILSSRLLEGLTFRTTSPSWMLPSLAARLSGEMSLTKMWLARRRPYSAYKVNDSNKDHVSTEFPWPRRSDHTGLSSCCSRWD